MLIKRVLNNGTIYYLKVDKKDRPLAASKSLEMLIKGKGLDSSSLLAALAGEKSKVLPPSDPGKIVCIGLNYNKHAEETNKKIPKQPLIFLKPSTAILAHGETIKLPSVSDNVHFEGELAFVIGKRATGVSSSEAMDYILGFTIFNDVTARDIQRSEGFYTRAKGFDTFAPVGPVIATDIDPEKVAIKTTVNGEVKQSSGCDDMIFKIPQLVEFISSVMTLEPGDIVTTGTPSGVGPLHKGDQVAVKISQIGTLINNVK
ncbi:MAG: fumarylacetoacetate hydrolase family protein [Deltaproteobacteria bacterium]|jgi:2-keto-4-pentenoate hydratase/2-oxohepta-3-ene-1,7-dioic acid hydratase in catechol pathway|nr:fumarylacetoacetate hydrolase family protein [Deltaproteobacteria bacterium]